MSISGREEAVGVRELGREAQAFGQGVEKDAAVGPVDYPAVENADYAAGSMTCSSQYLCRLGDLRPG